MCEEQPLDALRPRRGNQEDTLRHTWAGYIAGTGGGVEWMNERMCLDMFGTGQEVKEEMAILVGPDFPENRDHPPGLVPFNNTAI